ncbi:MAG: hypothetical protein U0359_29645 [Byssovorax sp.]
MRIVGAPTRSLLLGLLVTAAPLTGCAETMGADKIAMERDQARLAAAQRDQWIRALEWQLAAQRSDAEVTRQRSEGFLRELWTRTLELAAQNAALAEQLKKAEADRAALAAQNAGEGARDPRGRAAAGGARPDDLRRVQAGIEARITKLEDQLTRIEVLVKESRAKDARPPGRPLSPTLEDVVDPWSTRR